MRSDRKLKLMTTSSSIMGPHGCPFFFCTITNGGKYWSHMLGSAFLRAVMASAALSNLCGDSPRTWANQPRATILQSACGIHQESFSSLVDVGILSLRIKTYSGELTHFMSTCMNRANNGMNGIRSRDSALTWWGVIHYSSRTGPSHGRLTIELFFDSSEVLVRSCLFCIQDFSCSGKFLVHVWSCYAGLKEEHSKSDSVHFIHWGAKLILTCQNVLKCVWPSMSRYEMFFVHTSRTLSPNMDWKLTEHAKQPTPK